MSKRIILVIVSLVLFVAFGIFMWKGYVDLREFQTTVSSIKVELKPFAENEITTEEQREVVKVCEADRAVHKEFPPEKIPDYCRCLGVNLVAFVYPMVPAERRHVTELVTLDKSYNQALATTVAVRETCRHRVMPEEMDVSPIGVKAPVKPDVH